MSKLKILVLLLLLPSLVSPHPALAADPNTACIGESLAKYLNAIVAGAGSLDKIRLLSPAFNLTSRFTPAIFNAMLANGANFGGLSGFSGNLYTVAGINAYDWYATVRDENGKTWREKFGSTPVVFTEFGDFDTFTTPIDNRPTLIQKMRNEYTRTSADALVIGINYFNALGGNPGFKGHMHSESEIREIVSPNPVKAGINSAQFLDGSGTFVSRVASLGAHWSVEIINGPGDLGAAVTAVNQAVSRGVNPVLRACVGSSCGFSDPATYVSFLQSLNSSVNGPVWVIAGPNEPDSESWASNDCSTTTTSPTTPAGECLESNEKYPLRPYPGAPCIKRVPQPTTLQCANQPILLGRRDFTVVCPQIGTNLDGSPIRADRCSYQIPYDADQEIKFSGVFTAQVHRTTETSFTSFAEYDRPDYSPDYRFNKSTYLADYLGGSGAVFYDTQPFTKSDPTTPTHQDIIDKSAIWQRLTPYGYQNKQKIALQARAKTKEIHNYIALNSGTLNNAPLPRNDNSFFASARRILEIDPPPQNTCTGFDPLCFADYFVRYQIWKVGFDSKNWKYVPAFSLEDTPAEYNTHIGKTNTEDIFVPHLPRIGEATQEIQTILSPHKLTKIALPQ